MDVAMETPLDVLSRAATMVQNEEREAALKRGAEVAESPVDQDLQSEYSPSCKRLRESPPCHQDNDTPPQKPHSNEEEHRKCIATQTAFSSFPDKANSPEPAKPSRTSYPSPPPYMSIDHPSRIPWQPFLMTPTLPHSALPGYQSLSPLPSHHKPRHPLGSPGNSASAAAGDNMPLNLSVSSSHTTGHRDMHTRPDSVEEESRNSSPGVPERLLHGRPMTTANGTVFYPNPAHSGNMAGLEARTRPRDNTQTDMCDPSIEEHFRRSLGSAYSESSQRSASASPPTSPVSPPQPSPRRSRSPAGQEPKVKLVSVSATVDDHFAKALGNQTWNQLKTKAESHSSVDDHFAKALGTDTWHQLQAKQKVTPPH